MNSRPSHLRVAILSISPFRMGLRRPNSATADNPFSLASRQLEVAALGKGCETRLFEWAGGKVEELVEDVERFDPHIIGLSMYVWSAPTLMAMAERLKANNPTRPIIVGGPSARPAMLNQEPFRRFHKSFDMLVLGEGENAWYDVLDSYGRTDRWDHVRGVALPRPGGTWKTTAPAEFVDINTLPSPYADGNADTTICYLETFRGCPLSCSFCEWGVTSSDREVASVERLVRDFEALKAGGCQVVFSTDAALNLNAKAFRNLVEAEARTGFLATQSIHAEVYPTHLRGDHIEFIKNMNLTLGIGLQSAHKDVLDNVGRHAKPQMFRKVVEELSEMCEVWIEIIMGLPGDSLSGFMETVEFARTLPGKLRVFRGLALPDGLMTRGSAEDQLDFDPVSLEIRSCRGWSARDFDAAIDNLCKLGLVDTRRYNPNFQTGLPFGEFDAYVGTPLLPAAWNEIGKAIVDAPPTNVLV